MKTITFKTPFKVGDRIKHKLYSDTTFTVLGMRVEYFKSDKPEFNFYLRVDNRQAETADDLHDYISHDRVDEYELIP